MNANPAPEDATVDAILAQLQSRVTAAQAPQARTFASHLLRRVSAEDLAGRSAESWAAITLGLLDFLRVRQPGAASIRAFNPNLEDHGWESTHTAVEIVTEDAPFLVDSVGIAVSLSGLLLHSIIHPVFNVERDPGGHVLTLEADGAGKGKGKSESVMHLEVDRVTDAVVLERLEHTVRGALQDVAHCVRDWSAMRDKMLSIANEMVKYQQPAGPEGVAEGQEFLRWAANEHFTFLGYREYRVAKSGSDEVLKAVDESGLGILRQGERSMAPRSLRSLAAHAVPQSGSMDAIILTKTNARAHRAPARPHGLHRRARVRCRGRARGRAPVSRPVRLGCVHAAAVGHSAGAAEVRGGDDALGPAP